MGPEQKAGMSEEEINDLNLIASTNMRSKMLNDRNPGERPKERVSEISDGPGLPEKGEFNYSNFEEFFNDKEALGRGAEIETDPIKRKEKMKSEALKAYFSHSKEDVGEDMRDKAGKFLYEKGVIPSLDKYYDALSYGEEKEEAEERNQNIDLLATDIHFRLKKIAGKELSTLADSQLKESGLDTSIIDEINQKRDLDNPLMIKRSLEIMHELRTGKEAKN